MGSKQLNCVLRHVRSLIGLPAADDLTDSQLLDRFCADYDEAAFAVLVRRHGPLVQRVCRRVLADNHAAEDAFQATFLVLARKAANIRQRSSIAGWLYEVAYHLAIRARGSAARRRQHEKQAGAMSRESDESHQFELRELLDEELHQLPEKYRTPLVLCYLEGKTQEEAARQLGWPAGSMSCRLARGRELLRERLTGRGVALAPAGMVPMLMESAATAGVAEGLVDTTVKAAVHYAAGSALAAGAVSAEAIALAEGAFHTMVTTKLKIAAAILLAGLLSTGARVLIPSDAMASTLEPVAADKAPAGDKDARTDVHGDSLPAGAVMRLGTLRWRHSTPLVHIAYLADGKEVLTVTQDGAVRVWEQSTGKILRKFGHVAVMNHNQAPPVRFGLQAEQAGDARAPIAINPQASVPTAAAIAPDTKTLAIAYMSGTISLWDTASGKETKSFRADGSNPVGAAGKPAPYFGGGANMLLFAQDSKALLARSYDSQFLRLFDLPEGKERQKFETKPKPFNQQNGTYSYFANNPGSVSLSADGKTVATVYYEFEKGGKIKVFIKTWDVATGKEQPVVNAGEAQGGFQQAAFSPDAKVLALCHYQEGILLLDAATGKQTHKVPPPQNRTGVTNPVFTADGKVLALRNSNDQSIRLIDVAAGKDLRTLGEAGENELVGGNKGVLVAYVNCNLAFSADGKFLATGTAGNAVRQFDVAAGKELAAESAGHQGSVVSLAVSPDGKTIVTRGSNNAIHLWDAASGKETKRFQVPGAQFAAFSGDGAILALGVQGFQKRGGEPQIAIWDVKEGKEIKEWKLGQNGFTSVAISADGKTVATRDYTSAIKVWDVAKGTELKTISEVPANNDGGLNQLKNIGFVGQVGAPNLVFSPDGMLLAGIGGGIRNMERGAEAAGGAPSLRIWDVATGKVVRRFDAPKTGIASFVFSADGRTIASINSDSTVSLWEAASGKERMNFAVVKPVKAEAPVDGKAAKEELAKRAYPGPYYGQPLVKSLAYAPDSRCLATGGADGIVRLWDVATGKESTQFKGHDGEVVSLAFSANGKRLVSGSADTTALIWDSPAADPQANLEIDATRVDTLWADLASTDAAKAYQAIVALRAAPKTAVPFLKERIKAIPAPEAKKLEQLIADLDSNQFAARTRANDELEKMGKLAKGALDQAMAAGPNLEMRQRLERLLEKLVTGAAPPPEQLRVHRSLEVLEWIGTAEAQEVLQTVAKGAAGADVTVDAKTSLDRLGKR